MSLMMFTSLLGAASGLIGAMGQARSAELNAENIETQRIYNDAAAAARASDRYETFKLARSANTALLAATMGRDTGGEDRSVAAFMRRNKATVARDMGNIEHQRQMESFNYQIQAAGERRRAGDIAMSGMVNAFTSVAGAIMNYEDIRMPNSDGMMYRSPLASSPRPRPNPRY